MPQTLAQSETPRQRWLEVLDCFLITGLFAILPLEHTQAARNLLCFCIGLRGVWLLVQQQDQVFLKWSWPLLPWLAWASASYFWSVAPEKTLVALEHDLWLPMFTLLGTNQIFRIRNSLNLLLFATSAGTFTNAAVTIFGANDPGIAIYPLAWANYYFTTTGFSSTYALYFTAITLPWVFWKHSKQSAWATGVVLLNFLVALIDKNRVVFLAEAIMILLLVWSGLIKISPRTKIVALIAAVLSLVFLVQVNQYRIRGIHPGQDGFAGLVRQVQDDPRIKIWRLWHEKTFASPLLGQGFGRDVPPVMLLPEDRQAFAVDMYAALHSHNLFLQTLLETGWIGVACLAFLLWKYARFFYRSRAIHEFVSASGLLIISAMILKNMTDIFTLFGPAVLFYAALGILSATVTNARTVRKETSVTTG